MFEQDVKITLFEKNDMRIQIYVDTYGNLELEVDRYYTLKGFWGDEDYYQHYVIIKKDNVEIFFGNLKQHCVSDSLLLCCKEKFCCDSADLALIDYCKKNKIPFFYWDNITGSILSDDKYYMKKLMSRLNSKIKKLRDKDYKIS